MAIVNLLFETQAALKKHGFKMKNIVCIRNAEGYIPIADFEKEAYKIVYDNDFGEVEIDPTLKIIGKFWWMTREEYDGKEGWMFHAKPRKPALKAVNFNLKNTRNFTTSSFDRDVEFYEGENK